jgi:hypothetical protein
LLDILHMVPPLYHLNRETWPGRRERILRHLAFWGPLHRELASCPLTQLEWLTADRMVQRTTFQTTHGAVTITVNFGRDTQAGCPPYSAVVDGALAVSQRACRARGSGVANQP